MPSPPAPARTVALALALALLVAAALAATLGTAIASVESPARLARDVPATAHHRRAKHGRMHRRRAIAVQASARRPGKRKVTHPAHASGGLTTGAGSTTTTTPPGGSATTTPPGGSTATTTAGGSTTTTSTTAAGSAASTAGASSSTGSSPAPVGVPGNWRLIFDDEFNGSALDTTVWNEHIGWTDQNSVTDSASNVAVSGGHLILTLASSLSGAEIETNTFGLAVGEYAEARIDFAGDGTSVYDWPAWWITGPNWPAAGENDIAEGLGTLTVNYHSPSGAHNQGTVPGVWTGGFHAYGIYRGSDYCDVYWDGKLVKSYATDDNGQPENLELTIGAGNTLEFGARGEMVVDYVRAWAPDA